MPTLFRCKRILGGNEMVVKTISLIDFDSKAPNLAIMKLSAWHKSQGSCPLRQSLIFGSEERPGRATRTTGNFCHK